MGMPKRRELEFRGQCHGFAPRTQMPNWPTAPTVTGNKPPGIWILPEDVDSVSTRAPSPETSTVPSLASSPYLAMQDSPWCDSLRLDELTLPDAGMDEPKSSISGKTVFTLNGFDTFTLNLAELLTEVQSSVKCTTEATNDKVFSLPPGFRPPPGLPPPPGLSPQCLDALEGQSTVESAESILPPGCVTAMLRNIPNKYTRDMLIEKLHASGHKSDLDFLYLPVDFKHGCNLGYAFVSFRSPEACRHFASDFHSVPSSEKLPGYKSKKVCEVTAAVHQGSAENVRRLQASSVLSKLVTQPEWLPRLFDENGNGLDFPVFASTTE